VPTHYATATSVGRSPACLYHACYGSFLFTPHTTWVLPPAWEGGLCLPFCLYSDTSATLCHTCLDRFCLHLGEGYCRLSTTCLFSPPVLGSACLPLTTVTPSYHLEVLCLGPPPPYHAYLTCTTYPYTSASPQFCLDLLVQPAACLLPASYTWIHSWRIPALPGSPATCLHLTGSTMPASCLPAFHHHYHTPACLPASHHYHTTTGKRILGRTTWDLCLPSLTMPPPGRRRRRVPALYSHWILSHTVLHHLLFLFEEAIYLIPTLRSAVLYLKFLPAGPPDYALPRLPGLQFHGKEREKKRPATWSAALHAGPSPDAEDAHLPTGSEKYLLREGREVHSIPHVMKRRRDFFLNHLRLVWKGPSSSHYTFSCTFSCLPSFFCYRLV